MSQLSDLLHFARSTNYPSSAAHSSSTLTIQVFAHHTVKRNELIGEISGQVGELLKEGKDKRELLFGYRVDQLSHTVI